MEVIFARESGDRINRAVQGDGGFEGEFDGFAAEHRQSARQREADRADVRVGRRAEAGGAAAENLGAGGELAVDFETDDGLVFCDEVRWS